MNGDVRLVLWLVSAPAVFVWRVAAGIARLAFGDDATAKPSQLPQDATEPAPEGAAEPQPLSNALSAPQTRPEETR